MESSSQSAPACLHVFAIPELAHLICKPARKRDNVSLMRVCRQLFHDICPFVWESTNAVVTLVSMIPGAGIVLYGGDLLPLLAVMQFPNTLDLSRLNIYAPYIKHLEIPLELHVDEYENWDGFLAATRSTSLLPNLEHIHMPFFVNSGADIVDNILNWVTTFLSPALLSLSTPQRPYASFYTPLNLKHSWIGLEPAQHLLQDISQKCPRFESLELSIGDIPMRRPPGHRPASSQRISGIDFSYSSPEIPSSISCFETLRTLTTTPFILNADVFLALAQLPSLESLIVRGQQSQVYGNDLKIPDRAFLALRHLELHHLTWGTIRNLCSQKSLWQGLRTLRIQGFEPHRWPEVEDDPHLLSEIIFTFADHRSPLTTLSLTGAIRQWTSPQMIDSLRRLPLSSLFLGHFDKDHCSLESILSALPTLEELRIHAWPGFQFLQLRSTITSLPLLRRLHLPMDYDALEHLPMEDMAPSQTRSRDSFLLESNIHVLEPIHESVEKAARYLYALKPNMVYAASESDVHYSNGIHWVNPTGKLINEALSRLREASAGTH